MTTRSDLVDFSVSHTPRLSGLGATVFLCVRVRVTNDRLPRVCTLDRFFRDRDAFPMCSHLEYVVLRTPNFSPFRLEMDRVELESTILPPARRTLFQIELPAREV